MLTSSVFAMRPTKGRRSQRTAPETNVITATAIWASSLSNLTMAPSTFDSYAAKVCRHSERKPGPYASNTLNTIILDLPCAEAHLVLKGRDVAELPRLGETLSFQDHLQRAFFDVVRLPDAELHLFTVPILIRQTFLERLEGWREWRTLTAYLGQQDLEPCIVFKNTPIPLKESLLETVTYYLADVRVLFCRRDPFIWHGA